jgi:hypothetical protein
MEDPQYLRAGSNLSLSRAAVAGTPQKRSYPGGTAPLPTAAFNQRWSFDMNLEFAAITYRAFRDRIRAQEPQIDEQTSKPWPTPLRASPTCMKSSRR